MISQYSKDLDEAIRLGVPAVNCHAARTYYPEFVKNLDQQVVSV